MKQAKGRASRQQHVSKNIPSLQESQSLPTPARDAAVRSPVETAILLLKLLIYAVGQVLAYQVEFGAVFFCLSLLYLIWSSLDDRKRRRDELSAYSVFNPNCESIEGTVTADQLQKQLTFGVL